MPKLTDFDVCVEGAWLMCCAPRCRRKAVRSGDNGSDLPFCRAHLEQIPRKLFNELVGVAGESVFDADEVARASKLVERALAHVKRKRQ